MSNSNQLKWLLKQLWWRFVFIHIEICVWLTRLHLVSVKMLRMENIKRVNDE